EELRAQRRLDARQREHRAPGLAIGPLVTESLQDLLNDGQTRHDVVERNVPCQIDRSDLAEHLDPRRRVDERHERRPRRAFGSRRMWPRSPSHSPEPRNSRILRALARRTKSSSAISTAREYVFSPLTATASRNSSSRSTRFVRFMCITYLPPTSRQA